MQRERESIGLTFQTASRSRTAAAAERGNGSRPGRGSERASEVAGTMCSQCVLKGGTEREKEGVRKLRDRVVLIEILPILRKAE